MNYDNIPIVVKVMCILRDDRGRILVSSGYDQVKKEKYFRLLGGGLNPGEKPEDGIRREIREELNSEIINLKSLTTIDNKFIYKGQPGHETVYLFRGNLAAKEIEQKKLVHIVEETHEFDAEWIALKDVWDKNVILYPVFDHLKFLTA